MSNDDMGDLFTEWNKGELDSYLIEITATILKKKDETGAHVVDSILDKTGMKGTGRWVVQEAAEQSVAAPTIAAALDSRYISGRKEERVAAEKVLQGPSEMPVIDKAQILKDLQAALYCSKIVSYAQGLGLIKAASDKNEWNVDLALCARMWRGGCIIRASLLKGIQEAVGKNENLANLMVDPGFAEALNARHMAWRRVVSLGVNAGIALPAMTASLTYYDQYRRGFLPANMVQAQRDFFGGHTYERVDKPGTFHTLWDDSHKDIGDLTGRTAGEV
jgi:6-phosphogluconate dehydrogenase